MPPHSLFPVSSRNVTSSGAGFSRDFAPPDAKRVLTWRKKYPAAEMGAPLPCEFRVCPVVGNAQKGCAIVDIQNKDRRAFAPPAFYGVEYRKNMRGEFAQGRTRAVVTSGRLRTSEGGARRPNENA